MLVAIPSKGRAGKVRSQAFISSAQVFVPETEAADYTRMGAQNVVPVPDQVRGITATRNWILDHTPERWVVFVDDDLKRAGWVQLLHDRYKFRKMSEAQMLAEWERLFEITEDLDYRIWGVANIGDGKTTHPYKPFIFHTYVTASCMGMVNDGLRFDESFPVKEDYELCLRCIKEDGGVLGARYFIWENSHWFDDGGCRDYRTQAMEQEIIDRLIKMYPGLIRQVRRKGSEFHIQIDF